MTARPHATLGALALAVVLAAGCGERKAPARPVPPPAPAAPKAPAVEAVRPPTSQDWSYSGAGKRDPFRSYLVDLAQSGAQSALTRCNTPLGKFDLDQLRVVAVITGLADPVAMVEAPNGIGYTLHRGSCIGRNGGLVSTVRTGEVVVSEWIVRADGTREQAQTLLRLPKQAALNIEE